MDLSRETVTLFAACIAALTSIVSIFVTLISNKSSEFRVSHRKTLEPVIYDLSEVTYSVIAVCVQMTRKSSDEKISEYLELAAIQKDKLELLRRKVRYVLYGLDEALKLISSSPRYITHLRSNSKDLSTYIELITSLRERVDEIIRNSYAKGKPPTKHDLTRLNKSFVVCKTHIE
jgi:hypothetical protein